MTVRENLELGAYTLRGPAAAAALERVLAQFPVLRAKLSVLAGNLSGGEQQILETAMVLEAGPRLLLLDEPSLGLSPANQDQTFATIADLRGRGLTVLVVEQNAHGALRVSDTGIVMELGRLFMMGRRRRSSRIRASRSPIWAARGALHRSGGPGNRARKSSRVPEAAAENRSSESAATLPGR